MPATKLGIVAKRAAKSAQEQTTPQKVAKEEKA